jgi:hypothetical protein
MTFERGSDWHEVASPRIATFRAKMMVGQSTGRILKDAAGEIFQALSL